MPRAHFIIDTYNEEQGRRRAERYVELQAIPRMGETIDVSRSLTLKVTSVRWNVQRDAPLVFLARSEGTPDVVVEEEGGLGELTMPPVYVTELAESGWELTKS